MTGFPDKNYPLFRDVTAWLRAHENWVVFSPVEHNHGTDKDWGFYMAHALRMQLQCNAIAFLPGWTQSKGARREFDIACDLGFSMLLVKPVLNSWRLEAMG